MRRPESILGRHRGRLQGSSRGRESAPADPALRKGGAAVSTEQLRIAVWSDFI
jgi:hypothetical protein